MNDLKLSVKAERFLKRKNLDILKLASGVYVLVDIKNNKVASRCYDPSDVNEMIVNASLNYKRTHAIL